MTERAKPELPKPRCRHGVPAVEEEHHPGWVRPMGSSKCAKCVGTQVALEYHTMDSVPAQAAYEREADPPRKPCPEKHCILLNAHGGDCIVETEPEPTPDKPVAQAHPLCVDCGEVIPPPMVRVRKDSGVAHVIGSPACNRGVMSR